MPTTESFPTPNCLSLLKQHTQSCQTINKNIKKTSQLDIFRIYIFLALITNAYTIIQGSLSLPWWQQAGLHSHSKTVIEEGDSSWAVPTVNKANYPLYALIM